MSMNKALNAAVALIEGRTSIAKEIIREPGSDVKDVPIIVARLERSVNIAAAKAIRNALVRSLAIQPDPKIVHDTKKDFTRSEVFYLGVTAMEQLLEQVISELEF